MVKSRSPTNGRRWGIRMRNEPHPSPLSLSSTNNLETVANFFTIVNQSNCSGFSMYATAVLFSIAILLPGSIASSCRISAEVTGVFTSFKGGQPVMVDVAGGQTVTVRCSGSQILGIHLHQAMKGVEVYEGSTLVITPEQFKPGNYRCRCASSIEGHLNVSEPIAITGEGQDYWY